MRKALLVAVLLLLSAAALAQTGALEDDVRDCWLQGDSVHYLDMPVGQGEWISVAESCAIEHCGWPEANYDGPNGPAMRLGFGYAIMSTPSHATQFFGTYAWQDGTIYIYDPEAYRGIWYCIKIEAVDRDPDQ